MKKNILILTEKNDWFYKYAKNLSEKLKQFGHQVRISDNHLKIKKKYNVVFILSYYRIVDKKFLSLSDHNIVIHESDLPKGRGWAPLFWQVIEGKRKIIFTVFDANEKVDDGDYYFKENLYLKGHELYPEIREMQAQKRIKCCMKLIDNLDKLKTRKQSGISSYYKKRTKKDSEINIKKSILSQFNLLRSVDNLNFPAFFYYKGKKYILKIYKEKN
tara:strand:+ start:914 stop:1561 length:648 start_codon:yes stop_codon:yes gene_type:complete